MTTQTPEPSALAAAFAADALADVFKPRPKGALSAWCERHIMLPGGAKPGPLSFALTPYWKAVVDSLDDPDTRDVTIIGAAQTGKSTAIHAALLARMVRDPADTMVVLPNATKAEEVSVDRIQPMMLASDVVREQLTGKPRDVKNAKVDFLRGTMYFVGSESKAALEGIPAAVTWVDEFDRCIPETSGKIRQRGKTYSNRLRIWTGVPGFQGSGIDEHSAKATHAWLWWPCKACGDYFRPDFKCVRWQGGKHADPAKVLTDATLNCPRCDHAHTAHDHRWLVDRAVWLMEPYDARPQTVTPYDLKAGRPGQVHGEIGPEQRAHLCWHVEGYVSGLEAWPTGTIAAEFVAHGASVEWVTETIGRPFTAGTSKVDPETLRAIAATSPYARGRAGHPTAPEGTVGTILTVDVQTDRIWFTLWGFTALGRTRALLDWGSREAQDPVKLHRALDELRQRPCRAVVGGLQTPLAQLIDTGDRTEEIYAYIRAQRDNPACKVRGVRGDAQLAGNRYRWTDVDETRVRQLRVDPLIWKTALLTGLKLHTPAAASESTLEDLTTVNYLLPADADQDLLEQLTSEHLTRQGTKLIWKLRSARDANHLLDCSYYAVAAMGAFGIERFQPTRAASAASDASHAPTDVKPNPAPRAVRPVRLATD
jgi:phage terminase large subunit GpA-like protein